MLTFARRPKAGNAAVLENPEHPRNRKVPHLYREVLAKQDMPQAERASIRDRPDLQFPLPKCRVKGRPRTHGI